MKIGNFEIKGHAALAPMAGVKLFEENPDDPVLTSAIGGYFYYYRNYDMARRAFRRYMMFPGERRNAQRTTVIQSRLRTLR